MFTVNVVHLTASAFYLTISRESNPRLLKKLFPPDIIRATCKDERFTEYHEVLAYDTKS